MGAFLSVAKGSVQTPWLLEVKYNGGRSDSNPLALVGKGKLTNINLKIMRIISTGVTFDTGGISIKPSPNMGLMKGDMGGAACVAAATVGIATLGLPIK